MNRFLWPLIGFVVLVVLLAVGLNLNPREVPSPLVGKPTPDFSLPQVADPAQTFSPKDMLGKVWLLNVWATWCVSCREEHPILVELAKNKTVPIVGLNYKEVRGDGSLDADKIAPDAEKKLALERANGWLNEKACALEALVAFRGFWPEITPSMANSAAFLKPDIFPKELGPQMGRPGICLYGGNPFGGTSLEELGRGWQLFFPLIHIPTFLRDGIYRFIARNRYRWFGKKEKCMLPSDTTRSRFIE